MLRTFSGLSGCLHCGQIVSGTHFLLRKSRTIWATSTLLRSSWYTWSECFSVRLTTIDACSNWLNRIKIKWNPSTISLIVSRRSERTKLRIFAMFSLVTEMLGLSNRGLSSTDSCSSFNLWNQRKTFDRFRYLSPNVSMCHKSSIAFPNKMLHIYIPFFHPRRTLFTYYTVTFHRTNIPRWFFRTVQAQTNFVLTYNPSRVEQRRLLLKCL